MPLEPQDTLVFLGDYFGRGEDSAAVWEILRGLRQHHPRSVFLRGNHEVLWSQVFDGREFVTIPDIEGAEKAWEDFGWDPPTELGFWLQRTALDYDDEHGIYVHAGLYPGLAPWDTPDEIKLYGNPASSPRLAAPPGTCSS